VQAVTVGIHARGHRRRSAPLENTTWLAIAWIKAIDPSGLRAFNSEEWGRLGNARDAVRFIENPQFGKGPVPYRYIITTVGAADDWNKTVNTAHSKPVPFDEPTLGIIGMVAIRGRRQSAFRTGSGRDHDARRTTIPGLDRLRACGRNARSVLAGLHYSGKVCRDLSQSSENHRKRTSIRELADRRQQFEDELNFGRRYQTAYQDYEAKRIKEGASCPTEIDGSRSAWKASRLRVVYGGALP